MNLSVLFRPLLGAALLFMAVLLPAHADGLQALEHFIQNVTAGQAQFEQTVSSPAGQNQPPRVKKSSGTFVFERPGHFRFDYETPFPQHIVADGHTLWLYDVDLEQVTRRPQEQVLDQTPAALIAAATDLSSLQADFELTAEPDANGLQWVQAQPRQADGQLRAVRIGFAGDVLSVLEITDNFGQQSVLRFTEFEVNPQLTPGTFEFAPPAGVDVLQS